MEQLTQILLLVETIAIIGGGFYYTGRVTTILATLEKLVEDHESRLRVLENHVERNS